MNKLVTRKIAENTVEIFKLYRTFQHGEHAYDEEYGSYPTKEEAMRHAKNLPGLWFITVNAIVAESKLAAEQRVKRLISA